MPRCEQSNGGVFRLVGYPLLLNKVAKVPSVHFGDGQDTKICVDESHVSSSPRLQKSETYQKESNHTRKQFAEDGQKTTRRVRTA